MSTLKNITLKSMGVVLTSSLLLSNAFAKEEALVLESSKINTAINLDGKNAAWNSAKALTMTLGETPYKPEGFKGIVRSNVELKSLYDANNIYIKMTYDDPTKSDARYPWVKQADGTWKQLKNKDQTGHENTYYEDKAAVFWNINAKGFEKKGCAIACHMTKEGLNNGFADTSAGRKYTRNEGETIDMWHWKSVRTGLPFELSHDQYVNNIADPSKSKEWGRQGDEKIAGGYKDNITEDKKMPAFMSKVPNDTRTYIPEEDKVPFVDTFKEGDKLPGIVVSKMTGSAADVLTSSSHENGKWTLVFKRPLTTSSPKSSTEDIQFTDLKKPYYFGVAIFDNTQINHAYHDGSIKLLFK